MAVQKLAAPELDILSVNFQWKFNINCVEDRKVSQRFFVKDCEFDLVFIGRFETYCSIEMCLVNCPTLVSFIHCKLSFIDRHGKDRFQVWRNINVSKKINVLIKTLYIEKKKSDILADDDALTIRCAFFAERNMHLRDETTQTAWGFLSGNNYVSLFSSDGFNSYKKTTESSTGMFGSNTTVLFTPGTSSATKHSLSKGRASIAESQKKTGILLRSPGYSVEKGIQTEVSNFSDNKTADLFSTLSADFERIFDNKTDTDCVLKADNKRFPVHRVVLAARSPVFAAMFHHDTSERIEGEANIEDVDATTLSDVLRYVYSGKISGLTADTAVPMYFAADKYALLKLREECLQFLLCNLNIRNFCDAAILAHVHGEIVLENKVVDYIDDNLDQVLDSDVWRMFFDNKPTIAGKYLSAAYRSSKTRKDRKAS